MAFETRIGVKPLAALSRRLATSLGAGVDVRTVFAREANAAHGLSRARYLAASDAIAAGSSVTEALAAGGNYFPEFFREVVEVGERSGHLPEVLRQLAEYYEHRLKLRRTFLASITWPLIELLLALGVVGLLIWLMGAIPQLRDNKIDILGFGLTGNSGLATYLGFLAIVAVGFVLVYQAMSRGVLWVAPVQRLIMLIPQLGSTLQTLALARMAWTMNVTLNSGMALKPAMKLSLRSTRNAHYTRHIPGVLAAIGAGDQIHEALGRTGAFPFDFLDAVEVGEDSGQLVESMSRLADQYQDQARLAMNTLTVLMGLAVFGLVVGVIVFLIVRVFGFYTGAINDALNMKP